jgi:hypothetical protein
MEVLNYESDYAKQNYKIRNNYVFKILGYY